ncbi:MAG: type II CRISPR-associated endonuclease Cas1 [Akkermansia sp.]|nr:type II CRISPR-associated endonuclease Cas1 [Akkermansia sp.]
MSYHIISIDTPDCCISVRKGQLIASSHGVTNSVPLEDVASIVITSFKCTISNNLLIHAAKFKIPIIICEYFIPISILLPADRATDTQIIRNLAKLTPQHKRRLWKKTIDAKCHNQLILASKWSPHHPLIEGMQRIVASDKESKEAECAKCYWTVFSDSFANGHFRRDKKLEDFNVLFNYAYAILLSCILRYLLALGLDPTFGIFHVPRAHAAPLAYDLMEPFRPLFDAKIAHWINFNNISSQATSTPLITKEYKQFISSTLTDTILYDNKQLPLKQAIEQMVRSFRASVYSLQVGTYVPWKT